MAFDLSAYLATLTNPRWGDIAHTFVLLDGTSDGATLSFCARPDDAETHGQEIYAFATAGHYGTLAEYSAPVASHAALTAAVIAAAKNAAGTILAQIYPDATHQAAGQNAAMIAAVSGGAPASGSPFYAAFNAYASIFGVSPAALAALAIVLTNQSMALSAAVITLEAMASASTTSAELATEIADFETAASAVVTAVNAASPPVPLSAPAAIVIPGVNG